MKIKKNIAIGLGAIIITGMAIIGAPSILVNAQNKEIYSTTTKQQITITESEAKQLMTEKVPGAEIIKFKLEKDDGVLKYDGTLVKDNMEYDIDVNANTGKIISFKEEVYDKEDGLENQEINEKTNKGTNKENKNVLDNKATIKNSNTYISEKKAKEIMQDKTQDAVLVNFEFDIDDGRAEYEGELVKNNIEYDITLDAITGEIIEFEKDYDDDKYDHDRYCDRNYDDCDRDDD